MDVFFGKDYISVLVSLYNVSAKFFCLKFRFCFFACVSGITVLLALLVFGGICIVSA